MAAEKNGRERNGTEQKATHARHWEKRERTDGRSPAVGGRVVVERRLQENRGHHDAFEQRDLRARLELAELGHSLREPDQPTHERTCAKYKCTVNNTCYCRYIVHMYIRIRVLDICRYRNNRHDYSCNVAARA